MSILHSKKGIPDFKKAIVNLPFCKFSKTSQVGGFAMTEWSEREDETVDRKHGGPPKVGDKSPKVGGPFDIGHYIFQFFIRKRA